jgi:hypothetical protein
MRSSGTKVDAWVELRPSEFGGSPEQFDGHREIAVKEIAIPSVVC